MGEIQTKEFWRGGEDFQRGVTYEWEGIFMDQTITMYLNQLTVSSPILSGAAVFFAHYFPWLVSAAFALFVWREPRAARLKALLLAEGFCAALLAWLGSLAFRLFVHRPRPFAADPDIIALVEKTTYSFPSGHAAFFFALSTIVYVYNKRLGIWFFIASALISLARIAAGVHYPTDILGGAALGIAVGWGVHWFFSKSSGQP